MEHVQAINALRTRHYTRVKGDAPTRHSPLDAILKRLSPEQRKAVRDAVDHAILGVLESLPGTFWSDLVGLGRAPRTTALKGTIIGGEKQLFVMTGDYRVNPPNTRRVVTEGRNVVIAGDKRGVPYVAYNELTERVTIEQVLDEDGRPDKWHIAMVKGCVVTVAWVSTGKGWQEHASFRMATLPAHQLGAAGYGVLTLEAVSNRHDSWQKRPPKATRPRLNETERLIRDEAKHKLACGFTESQVLAEVRAHVKAFNLPPESERRIEDWL